MSLDDWRLLTWKNNPWLSAKKETFHTGQAVIHTNPTTGERLKAKVLGYRPEYNIYCIKIQHGAAEIVDEKDLSPE